MVPAIYWKSYWGKMEIPGFVHLLRDAPVSGGIVGAEAAKLTMLVGGDREVPSFTLTVVQTGTRYIDCFPMGQIGVLASYKEITGQEPAAQERDDPCLRCVLNFTTAFYSPLSNSKRTPRAPHFETPNCKGLDSG